MSVTAERLMVEVQADVRQALRELERVDQRASQSQSRMGKLAKGVAGAFSGTAIAAGIGKTISLAKTFDLSMRQVGVQTGQTGEELKKLSDLAMKMGADTAFSAQDASNAMLELAKGGLTAADIKAGALKTTMTLAAAGELEMASAAGYVTQAMNTFGLSAANANQVAVALAGGANSSTASVESLGQALSQVGPGAANAGMSLQETVAALAAFDNAGIKGSDAGTSLKTMLSSLVPATDQARSAMSKYGLEFIKANGSYKSMSQVAQELKTGLGDLSQAEQTAALRTIFGSDATRAATVLMKEGKKGVDDYVKATKNRATVEKMANTAMGGAEGAWNELTGSLETLAIKIGSALLPAFTSAAKGGAAFINTLGGMGDELAGAFSWVKGFVSGFIAPFKPALAPLAGLFSGAAGGASKLGAVLAPLGRFIANNSRGLGVAAGIITAVFIPAMVRAAVAATVAKVKVVAAFVAKTAAAIKHAAMAGPAMVRMGVFYVQYAAVSTASAAKVVASWIAQQVAVAKSVAVQAASMARVGAMYVAMGAKAVATMVATTARVVAGWVLMGAQAMLQAARMAAAWVIAMGPIGWAIAAVVGLAVLIYKNWDKIKAATIAVWGAISGFLSSAWGKIKSVVSSGISAVINFVKSNWKKIVAILLGPLGIAVGLIVSNWDKIKSVFRAGVQVAKSVVQAGFNAVKSVISSVMNAARAVVSAVWNGIKAVISGAVNAVKAYIRGWAFIAGFVGGLFRRAKSAALSALNGLLSFIRGIPGQITSVFSNAGSLLLGAGKAIIQGLLDGIGSMIGSVKSKLGELTSMIPDLKGPYQKDLKLLRKNGQAIIKGLVAGFTDGIPKVKKTLKKLTEFIRKGFKGDMEDRLLAKTKAANKRLRGLYDRRADILRRYNAAVERLDAQRQAKADFIQSATEGMAGQATVLNAGNSANAIQASLATQVAKVKEFAGLLRGLKKAGYSNAIVAQVAGAGVEGGMDAAKALLTTTSATQVQQINADFASIGKTASSTAKDLAGQMYNSGINAAQGLVKGLKDRRKSIEDTMVRIAQSIQKALKKALGIKSPSRVMAGLGRYTGQGLVDGMLEQQRSVAKAAQELAWSAVPAITRPLVPADTYAGLQDRLTPASLQGGQRAGSSVSFTFVTHNPKDEPQSRTTNKALAKVASLGLV